MGDGWASVPVVTDLDVTDMVDISLDDTKAPEINSKPAGPAAGHRGPHGRPR